MNILISIVIPCYNVENYIGDTLLSIKNQDIVAEVILVDDYSTDTTLKIINETLSSSDWPREISWKIIEHKKNKGVSVARNSGIAEAVGDYLFFVDSDDVLLPNALKLFYEKAQQWDVDLIIGHAKTKSGTEWLAKIPYDEIITDKEVREAYFNFKWVGSPWNKLISRDFLLRHELLFKPDMLNEDELWNFQLALCSPRLIGLDAYTYFYRDTREGSIMNADVPHKTKARANSLAFLISECAKFAFAKSFFTEPDYCNWVSIFLRELIFDIPYRLKLSPLRKLSYFAWISKKLPSAELLAGGIHGRLFRLLKLCAYPSILAAPAILLYLHIWKIKEPSLINNYIYGNES